CDAIERRSTTCDYLHKETIDLADRAVSCFRSPSAVTYCEWQGCRLSTAHEWLRAAFGDDPDRVYPWGDAPMSCEVAGVCKPSERMMPHPVGTHPDDVSPFGVLDMGGNVHELVVEADGGVVWYGRAWDTFEGEAPS